MLTLPKYFGAFVSPHSLARLSCGLSGFVLKPEVSLACLDGGFVSLSQVVVHGTSLGLLRSNPGKNGR